MSKDQTRILLWKA